VPLLAINSDEYATGEEFTQLLAIAPSVTEHAIYVICELRRDRLPHHLFCVTSLLTASYYLDKLTGLQISQGVSYL
jgi:hypothetical protein